jgi:tRNA-Thr(GGU) m(6)t(6)A37 methyltransferase TsaA
MQPIGLIHSPFTAPAGTPIQSALAEGVEGSVVVFEQFAGGLRDLEGFDRVWLLYQFDRAGPARLVVTPFRDTVPRGVFSTRAPCRPNPIGMSAVRLERIEANVLHVRDVDVLDGTPLLDIKPYVPRFDHFAVERCGWLDRPGSDRTVADGRFQPPPDGSS